MKVDHELYYKDSGSGNKGHYVESNESVSISLSHDYTTILILKCAEGAGVGDYSSKGKGVKKFEGL